MASRVPLCTLILLTAFWLPAVVHAEGAAPDETTPAHRVVKKKPKPKPAAMPDKPVPYTTITPQTQQGQTQQGQIQAGQIKAGLAPPLPPAPVSTSMTPQTTNPAAAQAPADDTVYATVTVQAPPPTEISLRCETRVMDGKKFVSQGVFYIQIFPSAVFPDEQADYKFLFVDPNHRSLIRETMCQDIACTANVSKTAYGLINRPTKKGNALRITLDRTKGAFYAEDITKGLTGDSHLGETGWCRPEPLPKPLF